jgi:CMP/dCMP kinase
MGRNPDVIAIDGPAASGKSTIGRKLAEELDYVYFDTGVMYRAITWAALKDSVSTKDEQGLKHLIEKVKMDVRRPSVKDGRDCDIMLDDEDITWKIRNQEVNENVSAVSVHPAVRQALTSVFRKIAERGGIVMVGRDIGTVVLPHAELKIYLDASIEERAKRRFREEAANGIEGSYESVLANLRARDEIDSSRAVAPLRAADDAVIINTDGKSIDQVLAQIKSLV